MFRVPNSWERQTCFATVCTLFVLGLFTMAVWNYGVFRSFATEPSWCPDFECLVSSCFASCQDANWCGNKTTSSVHNACQDHSNPNQSSTTLTELCMTFFESPLAEPGRATKHKVQLWHRKLSQNWTTFHTYKILKALRSMKNKFMEKPQELKFKKWIVSALEKLSIFTKKTSTKISFSIVSLQ